MTRSARPVTFRATARAVAAVLAVSACSAAPSAAAARGPVTASASTTASLSALVSASVTPTRPTKPSPSASRPSPSRVAVTSPPVITRAAFARLVSAAGLRQWLDCAGPGSLTLVVVPGLGSTTAAWSSVLGSLRRFVRTCVYDRPGLGHSPNRASTTQVLDAGIQAGELWALLQAAGERGPYVVLGHSYGGLIARAFVAAHRSSVRGVFLAESVSPGDPSTGRYWTEAGHRVDLQVSGTATHGGPPLGSLPLMVMSASRPDADHLTGPTYGQPQWMTTLWVRLQHANLTLSSDAIQVIAHSGHVLQQDDPPAVVEGARELVAAVHTGAPLSCRGPWSSVGGTCR